MPLPPIDLAQYENPVKVVGHHDERIQAHAGEMDRKVHPDIGNQRACCAEPHDAVAYFPEKRLARRSSNRHKVDALSVVVSFSPYGAAMMGVRDRIARFCPPK
jgi:hypothetical protein